VAANGVTAGEVVTQIGSAMSGRRRKLGHLLADPAAARIAIGHRGRLAASGPGISRPPSPRKGGRS
jgi:putative resolvase